MQQQLKESRTNTEFMQNLNERQKGHYYLKLEGNWKKRGNILSLHGCVIYPSSLLYGLNPPS